MRYGAAAYYIIAFVVTYVERHASSTSILAMIYPVVSDINSEFWPESKTKGGLSSDFVCRQWKGIAIPIYCRAASAPIAAATCIAA